MKTTCWYFNDSDCTYGLESLSEIKTSVKSAVIALKTKAKPTVCVVYPLPWTLPKGLLGEWLDFYIDAFALAQDYPERVELWPLDEFLVNHGALPPKLESQSVDSLQAFLFGLQFSEFTNLLEMLEMGAMLNNRGPYTKPLTDTLSDLHVQQILELLEAPPNVREVVDDTQVDVLQQRLNAAIEEIKLITDTLLATQVEMEKLSVENKALKELSTSKSQKNTALSEDIVTELAEKKSALHELEIRHQSTIEEAALMQLQIHKIFEQLEKTHFECEHLKHEAELAIATVQEVSGLLNQERRTTARNKAA